MIYPKVARILCALTALAAASCATYRNAYPELTLGPSSQASPEWVELCPGVSLARAALNDPDLAVLCVRADLDAAGITARVVSAPASAPAPAPAPVPALPPATEQATEPASASNREASLSLVAGLFRDSRVIVAINASPFSPVNLFPGGPCEIVGLSAADGLVVSPPSTRYGAIVFGAEGTGKIVTGSEADALWVSGGIVGGAGGFAVILKSGEVTDAEFAGKFKAGRAPRSAAGLSRDGRILYLMVIDGKNPGHSVGATFRETALWIRSFGADSALMLDGGGSSAIAARNGGGSWKMLNVPVQLMVPGIERPVANRIAILYSPVSITDGSRN